MIGRDSLLLDGFDDLEVSGIVQSVFSLSRVSTRVDELLGTPSMATNNSHGTTAPACFAFN